MIDLDIPDLETRVAILTMLSDIVELAWGGYFEKLDDLRRIDVIELLYISGAVLLFQARGQPLSERGITRIFGISRGKMSDRLATLISLRIVRRDGDHLLIDPAGLSDENLKRVIEVILRTAAIIRRD